MQQVVDWSDYFDIHSFFEQSPLAIALVDTKGIFLDANKAFSSLLELSKEELIYKNEFSLIYKPDVKEDKQKRKNLKKINSYYTQNKRYLVQDDVIWVKTIVTLLQNINNNKLYFLIIAIDISSDINQQKNLKLAERKLRKLVDYDELTSLKSRRAINIDIQEAINQFIQKQHQSVLIYIDIDDFKSINDSYGHQLGDEVLKSVGKHLKQHIRSTDEASRVGGDEFIVLLRHDSQINAKKILQRLSTPLSVNFASISLKVTLSVGAQYLDRSILSLKDWINAADQAMYKNKQFKTMK